jgi:hypothetical protein
MQSGNRYTGSLGRAKGPANYMDSSRPRSKKTKRSKTATVIGCGRISGL